MGVLNFIFAKENKELYQENDKLQEIKKELEHYIFYLYDKVLIIAEIKNKFYDIKNLKHGFIEEDKKNFITKKKPYEDFLEIEDDSKMFLYYKGWINRRLKRINKILLLELKSKYGTINTKNTIVETINILKQHIEDNTQKEQLNNILTFLEILDKLSFNLKQQQNYIKSICPLKEYNTQIHEILLDEKFLNLIREELNLFFGENLNEQNFNMYPAIISRKIHINEFPLNSTLEDLIKNNIEKIKKNKKEKKQETIICYHARPREITKPLLPIELKFKSTGFFVDLDKEEAINIVCAIYNIEKVNVEVYQLEIPNNLFKLAIRDKFNDNIFKNFEMLNSYIFRPTSFPKFNEFYLKNLIICNKIS